MDTDYEATRAALAVMTAWTVGRDNNELAARTAVEWIKDTEDGEIRMVTGLINLAAMLLLIREAEDHVTAQATLRDIALRPWNTRE